MRAVTLAQVRTSSGSHQHHSGLVRVGELVTSHPEDALSCGWPELSKADAWAPLCFLLLLLSVFSIVKSCSLEWRFDI